MFEIIEYFWFFIMGQVGKFFELRLFLRNSLFESFLGLFLKFRRPFDIFFCLSVCDVSFVCPVKQSIVVVLGMYVVYDLV